ncbi:MAG: hypothetical protein L3K16_07770 [Thermoplasmata archaeon]|nr:hypothetical protein [Thermoplasmata archaeon]
MVVAVALVVLSVGTAAASPAPVGSPPGTATPPYRAIPYEVFTSALDGCGKVSIPVYPVFNTTTGRSHQSAKISLTSCLGTNGTAAAEFAAGLESLPLTNMSSGHHNLTAHWSLSYKVHLAATRGSPTQTALAEYELEVGAEVVDTTTGGNLGGASHVFFVEHNLTHGSYYRNVTDRAVTTWFNVTLNQSHAYELFLIVVGIELIEVGPGTSTATVSVNLGPGLNGTRLDSVRLV